LGSAIAGVLIECGDMLNMWAVAAEKHNLPMVSTDFVHTSASSLSNYRLVYRHLNRRSSALVNQRECKHLPLQRQAILQASSSFRDETTLHRSQKAGDGLFQLGVHLIRNNHDVRQHRTKIHAAQVALYCLEDAYL
jgi:hypothetical protein